MSVGFGKYLKEYLQFYHISQTEFANRLDISQKHMNEILNGKVDITLEMAANIEKLTDISIDFIIKSEHRKIITKYLEEKFKDNKTIEEYIKLNFCLNELKKREWVNFNDITNPIQNYMDIIEFLKVKDLEALENIKEKTLFKKDGDDLNKLSLWIARADELSKNQDIREYVKENFQFLIQDLMKLAYEKDIQIEKVQKILNLYGIYFIVERALSGSKVRGCFKVKGRNPAIYITQNYKAKDSFYFELFHELGHCKSDYNEAKSKIIVEGNENQELRADNFALNTMIQKNIWNEILNDYSEENLNIIYSNYKIPMSFIVGRLAKTGKITYKSELYNKYKMI